tara:strand:- start:640 stop:1089 length:450 start_codon:yes stop_codon:yes gene_type:complete
MNMKIAALVAAGAVLFMTLRPNRNVRNNNPLNIRHVASNKWQGAAGDDGEFVIFESPEYGFRAAYKLLKNYEANYGINTLSEIVERWAPAEDNNHTEAYINYLAEKLDKWTFTPVFESELPQLLFYMAEFEGAKGAFNMAQVEKGISLA